MPDLADAAALLKELGNERMRDEIAAGIKYVRDCIPPPMRAQSPSIGVIFRRPLSAATPSVIIGSMREHLAFYLIDVTGHGLDSALLAVTITNVIRSGSISRCGSATPRAGARRPE